MRRRTFIAASIGALAGAGGLGLAASAKGEHLYGGAAQAFGTTISVTVAHADRGRAEAAIAAALHAAQSIDRLMSIYQPHSQVFQLNRDGVLARPDARLLAVLEQARWLSGLTGGAFDITVQPLWRAFSIAAARAELPDEAERLRAQGYVNWRGVAATADEVRLLHSGMALTLNGLAQGYAADIAMAALRGYGIHSALVNTGEFAASGSKPGAQPWSVGIGTPRTAADSAAPAAIVQPAGRCIATSGDYECAFTPDFAHHHIFDPALGDSPTELASVTVLAPRAMLADGLSTAFMVMGAAKAHALAAQLPGVDLLTIDKRGLARRSQGFI